RLPDCLGQLARVRRQKQSATAGVSQWDGQAAVPDDLHRRLLPVALDGPAGQHRRDAYLLGWVKAVIACATCASYRAFPCPVREFSLGAGDGNRTRTISLEG